MGAGCHEGGDVVEGMDAARDDGRAVQCGGGAGEFELPAERPVLEESVDEAGVEDVSGSGGVDDRDAVGGGVEEALAVEGEDAFLAEGRGGQAAVVAAVHLAGGLFEGGLGQEAGGKVAGDDEVVDVGDEGFDVWVELVEIGYDGDVGGAGPGGGEDGGFGVVAVDVEGSGVDDPVAVEVGRVEGETGFRIAANEDGALALGVDEDEGLGAGSAWDGDDAGLNAGVREGFSMEGGGEVVAELADVAGAEAPVLAGDYGGGDLAAGEDGGGGVFDLGASRGVGGKRDDGVGGVEAYADEDHLRAVCHR